MKRVTSNEKTYGFTEIKVGDTTYAVTPEALQRSAQHYLFTRFLVAIERGNDYAERAQARIADGDKADAARYLTEVEAIKGMYAEWTLPLFLEADDRSTISRALAIGIERMGYEVRDAIRNYPWKAEGALAWQQALIEMQREVEDWREEGHALALEMDAARKLGLTLEIGRVAGGAKAYERYAKVVGALAQLPKYGDARFFTDADGDLVLIGDAAGVTHHVPLTRWACAVEAAKKEAEKVAAKIAAKKRSR